jgi:hypothetical protein
MGEKALHIEVVVSVQSKEVAWNAILGNGFYTVSILETV